MCEIQFIKRCPVDNKKVNLDYTDKQEFVRMLSNGATYNKDAFGVFTKEFSCKKGVSFKDELKKPKRIKKIIYNQRSDWMIGHNRFTTHGDGKDNSNNHPFETENIIVVHNGVLQNHEYLKDHYELDYKEETDSAIIPYLIEHFIGKGSKPLEAIKNTAERIKGNFSVMIYSKIEDKIYYFKETLKPFYFALIENKDGRTLIGSTSQTSIEEAYTREEGLFLFEDYNMKIIAKPTAGIIYEIRDTTVTPIDTFKENRGIEYSYPHKKYVSDDVRVKDWSKRSKSRPYYKKSIARSRKPKGYTQFVEDYPMLEINLDSFKADINAELGDVTEFYEDYTKGFIIARVKEYLKIQYGDILDKEGKTVLVSKKPLKQPRAQGLINEFGFGIMSHKGVKFMIDDVMDYIGVYPEMKKKEDNKEIPQMTIFEAKEKINANIMRESHEIREDLEFMFEKEGKFSEKPEDEYYENMVENPEDYISEYDIWCERLDDRTHD